MSLEKIAVLKALGSKIVRTRTEAKYYEDDSHFEIAIKIKESLENAYIFDQYSNPSNPLVHYDDTAEEILDQCDGKLDYIVMGAGTGSTLTGIARKLKEKLPSCLIIGADPDGSLLARPETLNSGFRPYLVEGIGYDFTPRVLDHTLVDKWYKCKDKDSWRSGTGRLLAAAAMERKRRISARTSASCSARRPRISALRRPLRRLLSLRRALAPVDW